MGGGGSKGCRLEVWMKSHKSDVTAITLRLSPEIKHTCAQAAAQKELGCFQRNTGGERTSAGQERRF